jgi:hypothetical protein
VQSQPTSRKILSVGKTGDQKQQILEVLKKARGAAMSLSDIAIQVRAKPQQVLTLLGQLKGEVECVSRATMESTASMKWEDVDSKWKLAGVAAKAQVKWPPRPGSVPFGSESRASLEERLKKGKLSQDRVALAAWLGHEGALPLSKGGPPADLSLFFLGLSRWKEEVRIRGLAAAAEKALAVFEAARPGDARPRKAVEAVFAWTKKSAAVGVARGTALGAEEAAKEAPEGAPRAAASAAFRLGILASAIEEKRAVDAIEVLVSEVVSELIAALPETDLRAAVAGELGAWSLA